jgi:hypothetical protein
MPLLLIALTLALLAPPAQAAEAPVTIYVNNRLGADTNTGLTERPTRKRGTGPVATITRALALVPVGGHVSIVNTGQDYRESVRVQRLFKGRPSTPLVIDGHGATVSGLVTIPPERWTLVKDDVYLYTGLQADGKSRAPMPNSNWLGFLRHQGWFTESQSPDIFFLNGQPAPHVTNLAEIPAGGFFYETQQGRKVYFRLPVGKRLAECTIDLPQHEGVFVDDDYVVVRNLASKYSQDDGFAGFWGIGDVFENCNGSYNCDQGISLHGTSVTIIDGGLYERNGGCGIVDVMSSFTIYRHATVRDNLFAGALLQGLGHNLLSCRFSGNRGAQVAAEKGAAFIMTNCLVVGSAADGAKVGVQMEQGRIDRCTIVNCAQGVQVSRSGSISSTLLANCDTLLQVAPTAMGSFRMGKTRFSAGKLLLGPTALTPESWAEFAKATPALADNAWADPQLDAKTWLLPTGSPLLKAGEFGMPMGAVLPAFTGWPLDQGEPFRHPHP